MGTEMGELITSVLPLNSICSLHTSHRKKLLLTNQKHKLLRKAAVVNMKEVSRRLGDWQVFFKKIISHPNRESPEVS